MDLLSLLLQIHLTRIRSSVLKWNEVSPGEIFVLNISKFLFLFHRLGFEVWGPVGFFFFLFFHVIGQKLQHFSTSEADRRKKNVTHVWTQLPPLRGRVVSWPQSVSGHVPSKCPLVMTFWNGHEITMDQGESSDEDHRAERSMGAEFLARNWTGHTGYSWLAAGRKHSYVNSG